MRQPKITYYYTRSDRNRTGIRNNLTTPIDKRVRGRRFNVVTIAV